MGVPDWIDGMPPLTDAIEAPARRIFVIPDERGQEPYEVKSMDDVDKTVLVSVAVFPAGMPDVERAAHLKTLRSRWASPKPVRQAGVEYHTTRRTGPLLYATMVLGSLAQLTSVQLVGLALVVFAMSGGLMFASPVGVTMDARAPAKSFLAYEASKSRPDVSPAEIEAGKAEMSLYKAHVAEMEKSGGVSK